MTFGVWEAREFVMVEMGYTRWDVGVSGGFASFPEHGYCNWTKYNGYTPTDRKVTILKGDMIILNDDGSPFMDFKYLQQ